VDAVYRPGSREDFERLYEASYARLLATLVAMLGDRGAAEDCLHDAYVQAFRTWSSWKPSAPAEAWLHRIAVNRAISYQRWRKLREVGEIVRRFGRPAEADPSEPIHADLLAALRQLPPRLTAAVVLRHFHGYTNREIATALGIPERTVASRLATARKRLQSILGEEWRAETTGTSERMGVSTHRETT
jgi:RNA polymerase sigma factor (sigma-70 family)